MIYYRFQKHIIELERERVHEQIECIVAARLNGFDPTNWEPATGTTWVKRMLAKIKPCVGCGKSIV